MCLSSQMQVAIAFVMTVILLHSGGAHLQPPDRSYNILMLLPYSSRSHRNVFISLAEALADRGHKIVMLSNNDNSSKNPNITEINHNLTPNAQKTINKFENRVFGVSQFYHLKSILPVIARDLYKVKSVKELYEKRKQFDLIIVDHLFNEIAYPFVHEVSFITVAAPGMDPRQSAVLGNVQNPSYASALIGSYGFSKTVWERLGNSFMHILLPIYWNYWTVLPEVQKEISAQFPDLPPLLEIERNQSLSLMNTHFSITTPVPLLPSQVEIGAMHCRPGKPLPKDLETWIAGAGSAGVIYFSLGSIARGITMPVEYRKAFLDAFKRLPQRILWKFEEQLKDVPDNVKISNWLPQQDILAHSNVKVFISHGGLLSLQESLYHATPLLILPIFGDQPRNAMYVKSSGLGRMLLWEELSVDKITEALTDILTNSKYTETVTSMSETLRDQLTTPQERAVYWTEYVIRHRGAPQLRCPAAQLSWVEYLLLDVVALTVLAIIVLLFLLHRVLMAILVWFADKKKTD